MVELLQDSLDLGGDNAEQEGFLHLSMSERLIGAGISALCGAVSGFLGMAGLFMLNLRKFIVLFTLSSLLYFVSLALLIGFKRILSSCVDKRRLYSFIGMITGISITFIFGMLKKSVILAIVGFCMETLSFIYFALSYIPGGEAIFHRVLF